MSINYRQAPTLGYTSHPDYSADGAFTFTFNAGATDAQVAADPSLFNNWADLVNEATTRDGPVTVYFLSNCTVTGTNNQFPQGSSFIGVPSIFPTFTTDNGTDVRGVELFESLSIVSNVGGGNPPLSEDNPAFTAFRSCDFNVVGGAIWGTGSAGAILVLDSCLDASGAAVGISNNIFAFVTADTYGLELYNGTQVAQNCIFTPPGVAGTLNVKVSPGCTMSGSQVNVDVAWTLNFSSGVPSAPGLGDIASDGGNVSAITTAGAPFTWPTPAAGGVQLQTALLLINTGGAGSAAVTVGQISAGGTIFAQGQVIQVVVTVGALGEIITLLQPSGAAISGAPNILGLAGAAVGEARGCTLRCDRPNDPANCWSVIDTFVVPS